MRVNDEMITIILSELSTQAYIVVSCLKNLLLFVKKRSSSTF